jgi:hypothetical protein
MINNLEERVRKYIRMKNFFVIGDALMVTSVSKDILLKILEKFETDGLIIRDRDEKSIMKRSYTVISAKESKQISFLNRKQFDIELIKSLEKICKALENKEESISYLELLSVSKLSKGVFAKAVKTLVELKILNEYKSEESTMKQYRKFDLEKDLLSDLLTLLKQKEYKQIQEILDGKKPLRYVAVPKELTQVLNVIIGNEVLKRDELAILAGITRKKLTDWWQILKKLGVLLDGFKENEKDRVTYIFSSKRAKVVLSHIQSGAFEKDKELKHLWTR